MIPRPPPPLPPELLEQARGLAARARALAEGSRVGMHRSRRHGGGSEFSEHKGYAPGDDLRHLDWKVHARTDRHVVKRFESERQVEVLIVLDRSGSMAFGTTAGLPAGPSGLAPPPDKWDAARLLALAMGFVFLRQGDRVGLAVVADGLEFVPPAGGQGHLHDLSAAALAAPAAGEAALGPALTELLGRHRRALVILVSDLLCADRAEWLQPLAVHAARGREARILHVVDPAERDFPYERPGLFVGLEGEGDLQVNPRELARQYRKEFAAFLEAQRGGCVDAGLHYHRVDTDRPTDSLLAEALEERWA